MLHTEFSLAYIQRDNFAHCRILGEINGAIFFSTQFLFGRKITLNVNSKITAFGQANNECCDKGKNLRLYPG